MKTLRDDQSTAIGNLRNTLASFETVEDGSRIPIRRVVMMGPTGYGKTLVAASIISSAREKGKRVLITVPAVSLVDQTWEAFYDEGIEDVGVIQARHHREDWSKPIQIASVQTLQRREKVPDADIVLIDECHVWFKFYEKYLLSPDRRHVPTIGLSATPWSKGLGSYYQAMVVAGTTADLIQRGVLSKFRVFAPSHPDLKGVRVLAGDYHEGDLAEAMNRGGLTADIVSTWQAKAEGRPTICFAVNRAHAKAIADRFTENGVPAGYMDCESPLDERRAIRARFLAGEFKVVANVDVIGMGVDWPEISCVIYARPTRSEMRFVQNIGRALRTAPGKADTLILDHSDTHLRLGFVTDIVHDELSKGKTKLAAPADMPLPKECPACAYLKPPRCAVCPNCGHKVDPPPPKIKQVAGELEEMTRRPAPASAKFGNRSETYGMLLRYGREHGYKEGWVSNKYRELYGVWPRGMKATPPREPTIEMLSWIRSANIRWARSKYNPRYESERERERAVLERAGTAFINAAAPFLPGTLCTEQDLEDFK